MLIDYPSFWTRLRRLGQPGLALAPQRLRLRLEAGLSQALPAQFKQGLVDAVRDADLVVHAGSGVFADPFLPAAHRRLDLFKHAIRQGKPTALFSQGIGPLQNGRLRQAVAETMAKVDLITVRDAHSARLLAGLVGDKQGRFPVTGDDALELAYRTRSGTLATGLGLNLRFAPYSGLSDGDIPLLEGLLKSVLPALGRTECEVVPLAIHPSDTKATSAWMLSAGLTPPAHHHDGTVPGVLSVISRCRLVITGSYHGAVLALGQGIPAICAIKSEYYARKFSGLSDAFPTDCHTVDLSDPAQRERLPGLAEALWKQAETRRPHLLRLVEEKVEESRSAYRHFHQIVVGS
jgi:colanic acid/amylovoran biosynthesis protein